MVFAHELASDLAQWSGQMARFSDRFRCIAYDARGYPPSDMPAGDADYEWPRFVDDIEAMFDGMALQKAWLVGWSMGAYAALHFALRHPGRLEGLVVVGVGSGSPVDEIEGFRADMADLARLYRQEGSEAAAERIASGANRQPLKRNNPEAWTAWRDALRRRPAEAMARVCANYQGRRPSLLDFEGELSRLKVPVLILIGEEDAPCLGISRALARTIPGAKLRVFPKVGHAPNLEASEAFDREVEAFTRAVSGD